MICRRVFWINIYNFAVSNFCTYYVGYVLPFRSSTMWNHLILSTFLCSRWFLSKNLRYWFNFPNNGWFKFLHRQKFTNKPFQRYPLSTKNLRQSPAIWKYYYSPRLPFRTLLVRSRQFLRTLRRFLRSSIDIKFYISVACRTLKQVRKARQALYKCLTKLLPASPQYCQNWWSL